MVASVIIGMSVSAVSFMVINSSALRYGNDHNRQARIIAQEELEDPNSHFYKYGGLRVLSNAAISLDYGVAPQVPTTALRNLVVAKNLTHLILDGVNPPVNAPYEKVTSTVSWSEDGKPMSVTLVKRVAKVR